MARTQKARGFNALRELRPFPDHSMGLGLLVDIGGKVFPDDVTGVKLPCFARPCPMTPRHGFVESREVKKLDDVLSILAETRQADPEGEVIFMPRLTGAYSGIINHSGVTFGRGNDGATAGKNSVFIPAWSKPYRFKHTLSDWLCDRAGIEKSPYMEFVEHHGDIIPVQLRDGPEIPRGANYIPRDEVVETVVTANGQDLLEWERLIASYKGRTGVVVYHPGGSLSSHYAVHAIINKIAVIIDHKPQPGEALKALTDTPRELRKLDYVTIARWLEARLAKGFGEPSFTVQGQIARMAVATLHACPQWGNDPHLLRLRAEGMAATLIFTASACLGELRHWYRREVGPGRDGHEHEMTCEVFNDRKRLKRYLGQGLSRESVYEEALRMPIDKLVYYLKQAEVDLKHGCWEGHYGGPSWARCAELTLEGFEAVDKFIKHPTELKWQGVMSSYNKVINATHNGGVVLTKWIRSFVMDHLAVCAGPGFLSQYVAELVLGNLNIPVQHEMELEEAA